VGGLGGDRSRHLRTASDRRVGHRRTSQEAEGTEGPKEMDAMTNALAPI
jgi:hypothetical protein